METILVECDCGFSTAAVLEGYASGDSRYKYVAAYFPESGELVSRGVDPWPLPHGTIHGVNELRQWIKVNDRFLHEFGSMAKQVGPGSNGLYCPHCKRWQARVAEHAWWTNLVASCQPRSK